MVKKLSKIFIIFFLTLFFFYSNFSFLVFKQINLLNIAEKLKIQEVKAAITYVTQGSIAYSAANGTSISPAYPSGISAGDLLVLIIGMKPTTTTGGSVTTPSGWTHIISITGAGGYSSQGADTGNTNLFTYYKVASGSESGTLTVTISGNNVSWAQMFLLRNDSKEWSVAGATGQDTTGGSSVVINFTSDPGVQGGDFILGAMCIPTDVTTPSQFSAEALSQSGITFGTVTEISEPDSSNGNDIGGVTWMAPVSSGTSTGSPTFTATAGGTTTNVRGPGVFIRIREVVAAQTLTIGVTSGSKVENLNSGDTSQYINTTNCTGPSSCSAFTLSLNNGSLTLTSIKITETGTVDATNNLANVAIFYDTDGNFSNGVTGQFGSTVASFTSETATISGSLSISSGVTYYFYIRFDLVKSSTYPKGGQTINFQIAQNTDITTSGNPTKTGAPVSLAGTTSVLPNATNITYGSGLSDGGRSFESITISGYGFGVAPVGSRGNCSGGVDTGCIRFTVGGTATVESNDVSSWSNTSITFTINPNLASNGGVSAVEIVAGSKADATKLTFYIYPNITSLAAIETNAAREYSSNDTDGLVMIIGDHFGTSGSITVLGQTANTHSTAEGPCTVGGYTTSTVCVEVPISISDSLYSGDIVLNRGSDSKSDTFSSLTILPRIISNVPNSGSIGDVIQINGNHFCQGGTCPAAGNRSNSTNNVKFGSTQALESDFLNQTGGTGVCNGSGQAWTHTEICVKVPSGTPSGSQPTKVTSNTKSSNTKDFTVISTVPNNPSNLNQFKSNGTTPISLGGVTNETTVVLKADISSSYPINMALQVEVKPIGTSFTCGAGYCADAIEGTIEGGGACNNCTSLAGARITVSDLIEGSKHWQARVRNTTTNEYSNWISFGNNPETETDFRVDISPPTISNVSSGIPGSNNATISWQTLDEQSSSQVQYNKTGIFNDDCNVNNDCTPLDPNLVFYHSVNLVNLDSGTTYYYRVRSKDSAGNETISTVYNFITSSVTKPAKTVIFYIIGQTSPLIENSETTYFSVFIPEDTSENPVSIKSAFVEVEGLVSGGSDYIDVQVNNVSSKSYSINSSSPTHFKFLYEITNPNDESNLNLNDEDPCSNGEENSDPPPDRLPPCNKFTITAGEGLTINVYSAKIYVTYSYTP